jgi:uncharacterized repeat protein (TIGR03803 family)
MAMKIVGGLHCLFFAGLCVLAAGEPGSAGASGTLPPPITEQALYKFCPQVGCTDATNPAASLIMDASGNLYGTTPNGGSHGWGTVFKLAPSGTGWAETILYNFCSQGASCTDGYNPSVGLIMDGSGNLYGTTDGGGSHSGARFSSWRRAAPAGPNRCFTAFARRPLAPMAISRMPS